MVRTRFAPSPTGFLHIGGARTALFSWAFARHHQGQFVLRIEDTDLARSTSEAVQAIIDGMSWLGLAHDEGPFYQTQRMDRYKAVIQQMLEAGTAYPCYTSSAELEALRAEQTARGDKPRYDGRWRPEPDKDLPPVPVGVNPVIRFRNPVEGVVAWDDLVKGRIEISNTEMDDLIIARADGTPTYNFCVVVDDWDMGISQVIRGDDHVNNTPRQINILKALGAPVPQYAHLSMILGGDGQKLSKRHGAVSVMQYDDEGYLPEAVINYLARLGWSHGDDEVFSREQFVEWFDLNHITPSAAQFNTQKLNWLNAHYIKQADNDRLASNVRRRLALRQAKDTGTPSIESIVALYKDRVQTLVELTDAVEQLQGHPSPTAELKAQHLTEATRPILAAFRTALTDVTWDVPSIAAALKATLADAGAKMPALALPVRLALVGQIQTPSVDALIVLFPREEVLRRIDTLLACGN
ncbi:MAG: Glutamyl-tRNA synthetase [Fluviibacter phosphoraccumulans EoVTN8]